MTFSAHSRVFGVQRRSPQTEDFAAEPGTKHGKPVKCRGAIVGGPRREMSSSRGRPMVAAVKFWGRAVFRSSVTQQMTSSNTTVPGPHPFGSKCTR